jgi:hypothetical protein
MQAQPAAPTETSSPQLRRYALAAAAVWLAAVGGSLTWNLRLLTKDTIRDTYVHVADAIEHHMLQMLWDQSHASASFTTLRLSLKDGELLLEHPATAPGSEPARRMHMPSPAPMATTGAPPGADPESGPVVRGHLTSLEPLSAENEPDAWEKGALEQSRRGKTEVSGIALLDGKAHLRVLRPVRMEKVCLNCHPSQQAQASSGISVSIPMEILSRLQRHRAVLLLSSHAVLALVGLVIIALGYQGLRRSEAARAEASQQREKLLAELQQALSEVKTLSGILPICASCKRVRDDKGYWNQVESYIQKHSQAAFSHGICPECCRKLYPDYADDILKD